MYRWSLGSEKDEITVNSAYNVLDENLNIKEVQTKTLANRYVLNSRLVERDIFNLCRTIIGCQELQMYNPKSSTWDSFVIEDSELEDNGAVMQNIEIEIVKYNYL